VSHPARTRLLGGTIETLDFTPERRTETLVEGAAIVLLHEGLGSARLWREVPAQLSEATGRRVVAYSRAGYGDSAPARLPRPIRYMHHEADGVLPALLDELGIAAPVLVGHSDGASISLLYAGAGNPATAIVALAPHVFVEDRTIAGARAARLAYESGDLRRRLAPHHRDVAAAFYGWNDVWLERGFRSWSIEDRLEAVAAPLLVVQCKDDPYGTLEQLDRIEAKVAGTVSRLVFETGGHAPERAHPEAVVGAIAAFLGREAAAG
jgi:pimeloyl-ACP methyl ester carboxylesterase